MFPNAGRQHGRVDGIAAESAKDGIYQVWISRAYSYSQSNDKESLLGQAKRMIELRPRAPEGHYYLGVADELSGLFKEAIGEYEEASSLAGNDQAGYGPAARARRDRLAAELQSSSSSQPSSSGSPAQPPPKPSDIPFQPGSQ